MSSRCTGSGVCVECVSVSVELKEECKCWVWCGVVWGSGGVGANSRLMEFHRQCRRGGARMVVEV